MMRALLVLLPCAACGSSGGDAERYSLPSELPASALRVAAMDDAGGVVVAGRDLFASGVVRIDRRSRAVGYDADRWLVATDAPLVQAGDGVISNVATGESVRFARGATNDAVSYRSGGAWVVRTIATADSTVVEAANPAGESWSTPLDLVPGARVAAFDVSARAGEVALLVDGPGSLNRDASLLFLELASGKRSRSLSVHASIGNSLTFSEEGDALLLVTSDERAEMKLLAAADGAVRGSGSGAFPRLPSSAGGSHATASEGGFWVFEFWPAGPPSHPGLGGLAPRDGTQQNECRLLVGRAVGDRLDIVEQDAAALSTRLGGDDWRKDCRVRAVMPGLSGQVVALIAEDAHVRLRSFRLIEAKK
jgi:hypothetical protein